MHPQKKLQGFLNSDYCIGVSYLLGNGAQLLLGADAKVFQTSDGTVQVFGLTLSSTALLTVAVTIVATVVPDPFGSEDRLSRQYVPFLRIWALLV